MPRKALRVTRSVVRNGLQNLTNPRKIVRQARRDIPKLPGVVRSVGRNSLQKITKPVSERTSGWRRD